MKESLEKNRHITMNPAIPGMQIRKATLEDIPDICSLYQKTFTTYPFPIHDDKYIIKVMKEGTVFFVCDIQGKIAAVGSCEIDIDTSSVEMTDLATDLPFRGYGLSKMILSEMESQMMQSNIHTAYTICRSLPVPVNRLFAHAGYQFGGTLINNTNICGTIESMNVWYKPLHRTATSE
jgi:putative beta-lysine N-acetyltransferase